MTTVTETQESQPMSPGDRVMVTRSTGCCERTTKPYHGETVKLVRRVEATWCNRYMASRPFDCWRIEDHNGEQTCFSEASLRPASPEEKATSKTD